MIRASAYALRRRMNAVNAALARCAEARAEEMRAVATYWDRRVASLEARATRLSRALDAAEEAEADDLGSTYHVDARDP